VKFFLIVFGCSCVYCRKVLQDAAVAYHGGGILLHGDEFVPAFLVSDDRGAAATAAAAAVCMIGSRHDRCGYHM